MKIVCLGGGHGLHATLQAARLLTQDVTAIVCVGDDGGSSGRLRKEFGILPPGDIRMALSALASRSARQKGVVELLQHRFTSHGDLNGHALGNLILTAEWQQNNDVLSGISKIQEIFDIDGSVLPGAAVPLTIEAKVTDPQTGKTDTIVSQRKVAKVDKHIDQIRIIPENPPAFSEAVEAINTADIVCLGPGSWYTSLLVHMLVPDIRTALHTTKARKILIMNLINDHETVGMTINSQLESFQKYSHSLPVDAILVGEDIDYIQTMDTDSHQNSNNKSELNFENIDIDSDKIFYRRLGTVGKPGVHNSIRLASALRDICDVFEHKKDA